MTILVQLSLRMALAVSGSSLGLVLPPTAADAGSSPDAAAAAPLATEPKASPPPGAPEEQPAQRSDVSPSTNPVEDEPDEDDEEEAASDELESAKAVEARALSDDERLRRERILAPQALGPGNPLRSELDDLPDSLPQVEQDAREARQIARELEQFETFDASSAASRYDIPVELNEEVSQYIRLFQGPLRSHFALWLSRSARYVPRMREILQSAGVPEDTVFLSLIESGFSTLAYSVARAAGQWQFISSTGRRFGLRSDFWVDERRDPDRATAAAAAYLKELHGQLGSWYLAWAGYNAGAGTISKAIRREHSTDFWQLMRGRVLRKETKGYVPKLIAAALIAKHPHAFGFDDIEYQEPLRGEMVEVPDATELSFLAAAAGTDVETLRSLNPGLRRFCTPPPIDGHPYPVRVPEGSADRVLAALKNRPASERLTFRYAKVRAGEGLGALARAYGVPPEVIARMNGLHQQPLKPGRELVIPVVAADQSTDARALRVTDEREIYGGRRRRGRSHRLRRGTGGWRASDDCQDPFAKGQLAEELDLEPEPAAPPPAARRAAPMGGAGASPVEISEGRRPIDAQRYLVAEGDTLWTIAQSHGVSLQQLCAWNSLSAPAKVRIFPGQKLWVRSGASAAAPSVGLPASAAPLPPAVAASASVRADSHGSYTLRDGDNLWQVAKRLHVKVSDLLRWNELETDSVLQPGQVLKVGE